MILSLARSNPVTLHPRFIILRPCFVILNPSLRSRVNSVKDLFVRRFFAFAQNDEERSQPKGIAGGAPGPQREVHRAQRLRV